MTMMRSIVRFGRRQLHTIVSREIIKPSFPTPSHLKTYNLSVLDQIIPNTFMPMVTFYPNTSIHGSSYHKSLELKKSLSQTLTTYYPFAGRLAKVAPSFVDCNDSGAEFLEASIDSTLSDFLQKYIHEDLDQFFPHGQVYSKSNYHNDLEVFNPLAVQVNHFECGGVAVAVSMSHKIADASSLLYFMNDWANMTRFLQKRSQFIVDSEFLSFEYKNIHYNGLSLDHGSNDCVTKSFIFPNSKINELKVKVKAMAGESGSQPIVNPTRVEVLSWLLYKCSVMAARDNNNNNSCSFKSKGVNSQINMRQRLIERLPGRSIGNFSMAMEIATKNESELTPRVFINELKKKKEQFQGIRNIGSVFGLVSGTPSEEDQKKFDQFFICSSLCRYPAYEIDFGWGNPVKTTFAGTIRKNSFILMDTPNKDGIEAIVSLGNEDMDVIQNDHELLAFC